MYEKITEALKNEMQSRFDGDEVAEKFEQMTEAFDWLVAKGMETENDKGAAAYRKALRHALKAMLCMVDY